MKMKTTDGAVMKPMKQNLKRIFYDDGRPEKNMGEKIMNPRNLQIAYAMIKRFRKKLAATCTVNCGGCPFHTHICVEADEIIANIQSALEKKQ